MTNQQDFSTYCKDRLFKEIPEINSLDSPLREALEDALKNNFGAHIIYDDVFCPYVLSLIDGKSNLKSNRQILDRSFNLVEELANNEDFEVRCVAKVSFVEPFTSKIKPMKDVEKYLKPTSLQMAREIAKEQFGRNPETWEEE